MLVGRRPNNQTCKSTLSRSTLKQSSSWLKSAALKFGENVSDGVVMSDNSACAIYDFLIDVVYFFGSIQVNGSNGCIEFQPSTSIRI